MCRPIRALTEARGYATGKHMYAFLLFLLSKYMLTESVLNDNRLASFGGAGGQHACEIARLLGIKTILIHRYSSILSAYGLALADRYVAISSFTIKKHHLSCSRISQCVRTTRTLFDILYSTKCAYPSRATRQADEGRQGGARESGVRG